MSAQDITLQGMHGMRTNQIKCTVQILSSTWQLTDVVHGGRRPVAGHPVVQASLHLSMYI